MRHQKVILAYFERGKKDTGLGIGEGRAGKQGKPYSVFKREPAKLPLLEWVIGTRKCQYFIKGGI